MLRSTRLTMILALGIASTGLAGPPPSAKTLVDRAKMAAGGEDAFTKLGVVKMKIHEDEVTAKGEKHPADFTGYANTAHLDQMRLELPGDVVLATLGGGKGWATVAGTEDTRPLTPYKSVTTIRTKLFPLLVPFSLDLDGITISDVEPATWEGKAVWKMKVTFPKDFFGSPIMDVPWELLQDRESGAMLAWQFLPPPEYESYTTEGMRFRLLTTKPVDGVTLPAKILAEGITTDGNINNHYRTVEVEVTPLGDTGAELFLPPSVRERLDSGGGSTQP